MFCSPRSFKGGQSTQSVPDHWAWIKCLDIGKYLYLRWYMFFSNSKYYIVLKHGFHSFCGFFKVLPLSLYLFFQFCTSQMKPLTVQNITAFVPGTAGPDPCNAHAAHHRSQTQGMCPGGGRGIAKGPQRNGVWPRPMDVIHKPMQPIILRWATGILYVHTHTHIYLIYIYTIKHKMLTCSHSNKQNINKINWFIII
jgi:hypothetical protein